MKHRSKYSCESTIYFNLNSETIKENCRFKFYYNKVDITPTVLDGGNEMILANWPNDKHIICNINNVIPIKIPSHLYILVNRSVLWHRGRKSFSSGMFGCMSRYKFKISYVLYSKYSFY